MENYELTLSEYWRIMRKRQHTIALIFALVMLSTIIFTKLQTPIYEAVLELKIERHQPILAVSATGQGSAVPVEAGAESDNLTTDIQLITSLPILKRVAEKMEVLPVDPDEREKTLHVFALKYRDYVSVDQIHGTDILNISTRSSDPKKAALMATAIADVYGVENINGRKKQNKALIDYIDQQLENTVSNWLYKKISCKNLIKTKKCLRLRLKLRRPWIV
jgi:succinoglycan biosynthesis transport protein ExoP